MNQGSFCLVVQYPVLACVVGIIRVYRYTGKAAAIPERSIADRRYAVGDGYAGKAGATSERFAADRRYAVGDDYAGKAGAIPERATADSGKLVFRRERYAGNGRITVHVD